MNAQISCAVNVQLISAFVFHHMDCAIPLLPKFQTSSHWIVSDLVENPEERFYDDAAHITTSLVTYTFKKHTRLTRISSLCYFYFLVNDGICNKVYVLMICTQDCQRPWLILATLIFMYT